MRSNTMPSPDYLQDFLPEYSQIGNHSQGHCYNANLSFVTTPTGPRDGQEIAKEIRVGLTFALSMQCVCGGGD